MKKRLLLVFTEFLGKLGPWVLVGIASAAPVISVLIASFVENRAASLLLATMASLTAGFVYFRSDHFPFAKRGVPAINAGGGDDYIGRPADWGRKMRDAYIAEHYHKPSDVVRSDWDLSGAMQDL